DIKLISQGAVPAIQLAHAGRKGSTPVIGKGVRGETLTAKNGGWDIVAPSAIAYNDDKSQVPKEATLEDIEVLQKAFVTAAIRAVKAGFEAIELHFAHGFLGSTWLSPLSNTRTDRYGGSLENRMRFGLETAHRVRKVIPKETPLLVRISVTDYDNGGWDVTQSVEFAKRLKAIGVDVVDCSSGGVFGNVDYGSLNTAEVQHKAAATIQREAGIPTAAVGNIVHPFQAEKLLQDNSATLILIGRAFLNNPHWAYGAADVLANPETFKYPEPYDWCIGAKQSSLLFSPVTINGITLKNRIGVSPMVTWVSEDGYVNDFQLAHYGSFAIGGVGLIVVE
ncbi:unnamed protein product, partial [Oppiella nova]